MKNQTIEEILETNPTLKLAEMPGLLNGLRLQGAQAKLTSKMTAQEALKVLRINDPGLVSKTVEQLLTPRNGKGKMHECKTMAMWVLLIVLSIGYAGTNIYTALLHGVQIEWENMILSLLAPMAVIFHDRGITFKEHRDMLTAVAGNAPAMTIFEAMSKRIVNGPTDKQRTTKTQKNKTEVVTPADGEDY